MSMVKRFISFILCAVLCTIMCSAVFAASAPIITISNKSDVPGNSVKIDVSITNNPGIMGMTFSVIYDSNNFEFIDYSKGYISSPNYNDLSGEGRIIFAVTEKEDKYNNGIMMSLTFKIKDNAKPGKYAITLANHNFEKYADSLHNCFSNSNQESIVPTVKAGSITVKKTCENSGHKYSSWSVTKAASCTETGQKERTCTRCGNIEKEEIPITHDFEAEWTVDKAATPTEDGIMSRHCKNCDAVTDKITFTYQEVEDSQDPDDSTSSENNTSSNASSSGGSSSEINTSNESNTSSVSNASSEDNSSSESSSSNKTPIDNTVGAKNPLSAVENTKDYQENIKPNIENNYTSSDTENSSEQSGSSDNSDTQSITAATDGDENTTTDKSQPFISTPMGIVTIIICALLSVGIVALGIILIIRRKKTEQD